MKWRSFFLLSIVGGLLFVLDLYWSLEFIRTSYFFVSLLILSFILGVDLLQTLLEIFRTSWNQKGLSILKTWQEIRLPLAIFVVLGLSLKFDELPLHSGYFSKVPFLGRQIFYLLFIGFYPRVLSRATHTSTLFILFLATLMVSNLFYVDWGMLFFSPWHSTMFPLLMSCLSLSGGAGALLWHRGQKAYRREEIYEMGRLGITVLIFGLYLHFGQFLISWQARLPVEMEWYETRAMGGMGLLCFLILILKYLLPLGVLFLREHFPRLRPLSLSGRCIVVGLALELAWIYNLY